MVNVKLTRNQQRIVQGLSRKDLNTLKKYPNIVTQSKELIRACKKVIKKIEAIPEHANRRKRQTAYNKVINICQKAIDQIEK